MARLDRLGGPAKDLAQIAAAIGREFSHALLASVARQPQSRGVAPGGAGLAPSARGWQPALLCIRLADAGIPTRTAKGTVVGVQP